MFKIIVATSSVLGSHHCCSEIFCHVLEGRCCNRKFFRFLNLNKLIINLIHVVVMMKSFNTVWEPAARKIFNATRVWLVEVKPVVVFHDEKSSNQRQIQSDCFCFFFFGLHNNFRRQFFLLSVKCTKIIIQENVYNFFGKNYILPEISCGPHQFFNFWIRPLSAIRLKILGSMGGHVEPSF